MTDASAQRLPVSRLQPLVCAGSGDEIIYVRIDGGDRRPTGIVRRSIASGNQTVLFDGHVRTSHVRSMAIESHSSCTTRTSARLVTMSSSGGPVSNDLMTTSYFGEGRQEDAAHNGDCVDARRPAPARGAAR